MEPRQTPADSKQPLSGGPTTGLLILAFGAAEVAIIVALLALETPVSHFARQAAETWPGRFMLASIGLAVIVVTMIILLTIVERRQARNTSPADGPR
jgi:hypothetical protein